MTTLAPVVKRKVNRRAWPALLHQVVKTIRSRGLVDDGQHLLVAVSGGPDSVALLSLLHRLHSSWSLTLTAVHFNYGLRGAESDDDEEFVAAFCRELGVPLHVRRLEVQARLRRTSLQAEARDLRYRATMDIAEECGADRIAVGHTADDQAETVLLWMLRGAGLTGLSGMPAFREGNIIRPLYEIRRQDILAYLHDEGLSFRQDSSNAKPLYLRNRIRQEVLPILQRLVPSSVDALCRLANVCREDDRYLDEQVATLCDAQVKQERDGAWVMDRLFLEGLPLAIRRRVVRSLLRRYSPLAQPPSIRTVERCLQAVMKRGSEKRFVMKSAQLVVEKDFVRFLPRKPHELSHKTREQVTETSLAVPGHVVWAGTGQTIWAQEVPRPLLGDTAYGSSAIVVDADRLSGSLVVRGWRSGDRFHPLGMKGQSKKLQDFFTDLKVPIAARRRIPVLAAPEGIVWIVGYRQDERWACTAATKRYLVIAASEESRSESTREGI